MSAIRYTKPATPPVVRPNVTAAELAPPQRLPEEAPKPAHPAGAQAVSKALYPK